MRDLVARPNTAPPGDPASFFYRRAAGLEARVRPEDTWAEVAVGRIGDELPHFERLRRKEAAVLLGLTRWTSAAQLEARFGVSPATLWRWVEQDLLFFARADPRAPLTGGSGVLQAAGSEGRIARRGSLWPTVAVENAVEVAPMPFMPRGRDLVGASLVGARFASLERGHEVFGATITGSARLGRLLRRLIPRLDGRRTVAEVLEPFGKAALEAKKLLELLDELTVLELRDGPPAPAARYASATSPQVTWLGHGAVLIQARGTNVLVDPLFFAPSAPPEPFLSAPKPDPRALPPLDAVLITHGDNDHLNPNSLAQLPEDVPIYVPRAAHPAPPFQVDLRGMLGILGFERVVELDPWDVVRIGNLEVTACPFEGEDWELDLAQLTYLVEAEGCRLYLAADALGSEATWRAVAAHAGGPLDLAFMGVSGNAETLVMPPDLGYGNFYAQWVPKARHNEWVQHCAGPDEALAALRILKAERAFGYAAGGASFIRTQYSDTGSHAELAAQLEAARAAGEAVARPVALPLGEPVQIEAL